ncbi:uncharacterized protein LOC134773106 [Penaeus indicus]|uniref:uncharacterized protein LOC134773106 n=1 Tax=Penaeus indicus TaxID=29960 RepID=UPI00300DB37B
MRMLRFTLGLTRKNRIRNETVRDMLATRKLGEKLRDRRLRWFGHMKRREQNYVDRRMSQMAPPGKGRKCRPKRRFMNKIREDKMQVCAAAEDTHDRKKWKKLTCCGDP